MFHELMSHTILFLHLYSLALGQNCYEIFHEFLKHEITELCEYYRLTHGFSSDYLLHLCPPVEGCSKISLDHFFRRVRTLLIPQTWVIKPKLSVKIGRYPHFIAYVKQECVCSSSLSGFSHLSAFSSQLSVSHWGGKELKIQSVLAWNTARGVDIIHVSSVASV